MKLPHKPSKSIEACLEIIRKGDTQRWTGPIYDHLRNYAAMLERQQEINREATFLCARLEDFENGLTDDETATEFLGHVSPSRHRLAVLLED